MSAPQQIVPGCYQITRGSNIFILESGPDELTVIDTGIPGTTRVILDAIRGLKKRPEHVKHILITHADLDHVGSLAGFANATGATVYASEASKPYIENADLPEHLPTPAMLLARPLTRLFQKKATVHRTFTDGETLPISNGINAYAAPGHTPENHVFYWKRQGVLFAADLFFSQSGTLGLTPQAISWDMDEARESARKLLALQPSIICPGHGNPVDIATHPEAVESLMKQLEPGGALAGA